MNLKFTKLLLTALAAFFFVNAQAQETPENPMDTLARNVASINSIIDVMKRIKITGYLQPQYQVIDSAGAATFAGGNFPSGTDKRFLLRRARIKFVYDGEVNEKGWSTSQYVFQIDVTQAGLTIKDIYAKMTDPWVGWFSLTAGMQNRPFGYEVVLSSGLRESPERGRMSQTIFPNERDLGAMISIQGPKLSNWNWLKIDAGFFNGTGGPSAGANTSDFDKFKDFIGHVGINRSSVSEKMKWGLGASYYDGGFRQDQVNSYMYGLDSTGVKGFVTDVKKADVTPTVGTRTEIKRNYVGADGQFSISWAAGLTTIRAEYIQGTQPGTSGSSVSAAAAPVDASVTTYSSISTSTSNSTINGTKDTVKTTTTTTTTTTASTTTPSSELYSRKFNGAYFYFVQNIAQTPWQAILKYDWYDPNTDVAGDEIGKKVAQKVNAKTTNSTDIKYTTLGIGIAYRWDANVKLTAYYDKVTNETSKNLAGWGNDLKDDVFTLRMQVKF